METERRFVPLPLANVGIEQRANDKPKIVGYGAVFYDGTPETEYELPWDAVERIMPGAFDNSLSDPVDDVRGLFNHDPNMLLGRNTAGTMKLEADKRGLKYSISPPKTTVANDVIENIRAGNLTGSSFAFQVTDESWRTEDSIEIREIRGVKLFDTGPVSYPAYEGTTTGIRSENSEEARASYEKWESEGKPQPKRAADDETLQGLKKFLADHPVKAE